MKREKRTNTTLPTLNWALGALAILLLAGTASAQLTTEGTGGTTDDPFGTTSGSSTDLAMNSDGETPLARGCPHVRSVRRTRSVNLNAADGPIVLLDGVTDGHDGWITLDSVQNGPVRLELLKPDGSIETRQVAAGKGEVIEFTFTKKTDLYCDDPTGAPCVVDVDMIYVAAKPLPNHEPEDMGFWIEIPGLWGDISDEPDDYGACLWEWDTLLSLNQPRDIDLFIELTGDQDLDYEIIDKSDTVAWQGTLQEGALPQFQSLIGVFEDVKLIRYKGANSPVNPVCGPSDFHYEIKFVD